MEQTPIIVCENLVKIYKIADLEVVALQGLDLEISQGEIVGVIGASGSGKSTLMNIIGGLDRPSAGRIWVDGQDLLKKNDYAMDIYRQAEVGFVWQQGARNLIPYLTAQENVELPMTLSGRESGSKKKRRAADLLELVGLENRMKHHLSEMSGGEQQRVAIAVGLANHPKLILADEPTGEVDSQTALMIFDILKKLNSQLGITLLIVSHDPGIARHVNRVIAIRDGKLSTETIRQNGSDLNGNYPAGQQNPGQNGEPGEDRYKELTVLDSAGRLQIPKEYLEKLNIKGRVELELHDDGVLIRPIANSPGRDNAEKTIIQMDASNAAGKKSLIQRLAKLIQPEKKR